MASSKTVRRLAFAAMFQLDARNGADVNSVRDGLAEDEPRAEDLAEAMKIALAAWSDRNAADHAMTRLAPAWPAHRQALADRAILRLGHYELTKGREAGGPPRVVINDMVAIAKEYSTEKSPSFVNALLDKILKEVESDEVVKAAKATAPKPPSAEAPAPIPFPEQPGDKPSISTQASCSDLSIDDDAGLNPSVTDGEG